MGSNFPSPFVLPVASPIVWKIMSWMNEFQQYSHGIPRLIPNNTTCFSFMPVDLPVVLEPIFPVCKEFLKESHRWWYLPNISEQFFNVLWIAFPVEVCCFIALGVQNFCNWSLTQMLVSYREKNWDLSSTKTAQLAIWRVLEFFCTVQALASLQLRTGH